MNPAYVADEFRAVVKSLPKGTYEVNPLIWANQHARRDVTSGWQDFTALGYDRAMSRFFICAISGLSVSFSALAADGISYTQDIRPLLSNTCFKCHGPDANTRKAGLRLDMAEGATAPLDSGLRAIVPGDIDASMIVARITNDDPNEVMPPPEVAPAFDADEVALIKQWITEGAEYEQHWSFTRVERPELPEVSTPLWPRNPIDQFVMARLDKEGLAPSPEADRYTLIRRVSLDLTGLPPTPDEVEAFVNDESLVAYDRLVDRLLSSPRYGERWARVWLDLARYADSKGYEKDDHRTIWRYRDWVIDAYNRDLPFDRFTIEQLAGDLLENPTQEQLIATAFHRNTMTNDEGGTDDEEFRNVAVVDRVNTTMQVWMGITMGCAQCHSHKYDPISQTEFYEFFDFFNQSADADRNDEAPTISSPTPEQERRLTLIREEEARAAAALKHQAQADPNAIATWEVGMREELKDAIVVGPWYRSTMIKGDDIDELHNGVLPFEIEPGPDAKFEGGAFAEAKDFVDGEIYTLPEDLAAHGFYRRIDTHEATETTLLLGSNDSIKVWLNGEVVHDNNVGRAVQPNQDKVKVDLRKGQNDLLVKVVNYGSASGFYFRTLRTPMESALFDALSTDSEKRTDAQRAVLLTAYTDTADALKPLRECLANAQSERKTIEQSIPTTPVMQDLEIGKQRKTHIQIRGSFLDLGEEVSADVPETFNDWNDEWPRNRIGLAKWMMSRDNPLTARVAVNRYWEKFFGAGIVKTSEDFGIQGELPSHPELLDWLAAEFMETGWSMKELCRLIVTSATYRQSSSMTDTLLDRDPQNRLYARGPRLRLDAETIRDQALAVSGLLSDDMFGPSVMPYQPDGVWQVVYSGREWKTSPGAERHRRGLYTYWRRTSPYPSMIAFDAPSREVCALNRVRTNTPLQALVTLNDPVYVEAAQALARKAIGPGFADDAERVRDLVMRVLARPATDEEVETLLALLTDARAEYATNEEKANAMATNPLGPVPPGIDTIEAAAYTAVANVLLNLDETVTKL